jgi:hypothetical protein
VINKNVYSLSYLIHIIQRNEPSITKNHFSAHASTGIGLILNQLPTAEMLSALIGSILLACLPETLFGHICTGRLLYTQQPKSQRFSRADHNGRLD